MTQTLTEKVLDVFQDFRMSPLVTDQYEQIGKPILQTKMEQHIMYNRPIPFVMLGFPMKSSNTRDKVLGPLPDMGEELTIANFARFNRAVAQVYTPGVTINIVRDGHVFDDLLGIDDYVVDQYGEITRGMAQGLPIEWHDLPDFYSYKQSLPSMREQLMGQFGITPDELQRRILMDTNVNLLYTGMKRFMEEELANRNFPSGNQRAKAAKVLTREMMMRNEAYSALVRSQFSNCIRLSMHPSNNNGEKYSFQLIEGQPRNIRHSSWHSAILINEVGDIVTVHKKDAADYHLVHKDGQPYMYTAI
jgi:pyoverdine/dityrosine biosynthesis protein Dit1